MQLNQTALNSVQQTISSYRQLEDVLTQVQVSTFQFADMHWPLRVTVL
jgi:hypothetical protein